MSTEVSTTADVELWGIDGSIIVYGIMADVLLIVPLVMYLILDDTNAWAQYHQTYINMLFSAYAPLGISWFIVLADDSQAARTALTGAIEMAGLGPFALLWVGFSTFLMSAKSGAALVAANTMVWIWALIYPVMNIGLIIAHYHLSPPMYAWLAVAPMMENPIDSAKPWNDPSFKPVVIEIAPIVIEPIVIDPITIDPITVDPITVDGDVDVDVSVRADGDADFSADASVDEGSNGWL